MDIYIKRSDAIEETREHWITRAELRRRICNITPADVRPVVLCRDCEHCEIWDEKNGIYYCVGGRPGSLVNQAEDFCSKAKRRGAKIDGVEIPQKHGRLADLDKIEETMRIKCEEAKQKWRDSYKVISNEYDEGYMDGWQAALDELQKQEPFISADQANQEG